MPTSVYVASVIQLSLECLAIIFPLLAVTIWMNNSDTLTARDVAFDWVAGLLGVLIAGNLVHVSRPMCCIRCCCAGSCPQTTRGPVTAAAWLSVQMAVRTTGLLYNILADCFNESYWYSRSDMWVGPVECDASWGLVVFRGILLAASLLTFTVCLCCGGSGAPSDATFPAEMSGIAMDDVATSGATTCSTKDAVPPAALPDPDPEAGKGGKGSWHAGAHPPAAPSGRRGRGRGGTPCLGPRAWLGVLCVLEMAAVGLAIGLIWELEIRPECECSEQLAGAVWDNPPGCWMPSWADAYDKQPVLVTSSSSSSSSSSASSSSSSVDGLGYELYGTCDALMADLTRASCPRRDGYDGGYHYYYRSYYRPYGRGGGIGGSVDYTMYGAQGGGDRPMMVMETEADMAVAEGASSAPSSGQRVSNSVGDAAAGGGSAGAAPPSHSETNVQVEGVDEADVVKTDGAYVYVLHKLPASLVAGGAGRAGGGAAPPSGSYSCASCALDAVAVLTIVRSWPADDAATVATVNLAATHGVTPHDLFIDGDRLLVLGHSFYQADEYIYDEAIGCGYGCDLSLLAVRALLFDVSDRAAPVLLRDVEVEGDYVASRKVGDDVYVVSQSHVKPNGALMPTHRDTASASAAAPSADTLAAMPWAELGSCGQVGHIPLVRGSDLVTVWSLSMSDASRAVASTTVVGRGRNVYASTSALYVASNAYWPGRGTETGVLRFSLSGGVATFHGTAVVPGFVLNQFAMDERSSSSTTTTTSTSSSDGGDGGDSGGSGEASFRIATSVRASWWCRNDGCASSAAEGNHLFTFTVPGAPPADGAPYERSGALTGLAPGETIYSVRFLAERAYMVTYRQVDPLYVIDLADASHPTMLGYLKMPGYSDYLHPFNATHVLGLGRGGTDAGVVLGVKLALFDASDVANPTIGFAVEVGGSGSHSVANDDHKAFLYDATRRLLTLPMRVGVAPAAGAAGAVCTAATASANPYSWSHTLWQGAMVWNVTDVEFAYLGGVSHYVPADEVFLNGTEDGCAAAAAAGSGGGDTYWSPWDCRAEMASCGYGSGARDCAASPVVAVERALYIGDSLVTLSSATLRFDNLTMLSPATTATTATTASLQAEVALSPSVDAQRCGPDGVGGDPISGSFPPSECACRCLAPCERSADVGTLLARAIHKS